MELTPTLAMNTGCNLSGLMAFSTNYCKKNDLTWTEKKYTPKRCYFWTSETIIAWHNGKYISCLNKGVGYSLLLDLILPKMNYWRDQIHSKTTQYRISSQKLKKRPKEKTDTWEWTCIDTYEAQTGFIKWTFSKTIWHFRVSCFAIIIVV